MPKVTFISMAAFAAGVAVLSLPSSSLFGQGGATAPTPVYTAAQAQRGKDVYTRSCASCHGDSLSGGAAPPLAGTPFQASWSHPGMTLDDLLFLVRTTMPPNASSSLTPQDHAAAVAYILANNGYAAGTTALAFGAPGLAQPFVWAGRFRSSIPAISGGNTVASRAPAEDFVQGSPTARPRPTGPDQAALNAASRSTDWLVHTHDYAGTRHSPLNQLTAENASRLVPACIFQVAETDNFQTGPIVYNGVMYLTTRMSTIAIDAATCKPRWKETWTPRGDTVWERNRGSRSRTAILSAELPMAIWWR